MDGFVDDGIYEISQGFQSQPQKDLPNLRINLQILLNFIHNLILTQHIKFKNFTTFLWFTSKPQCMIY